jgi:amidase
LLHEFKRDINGYLRALPGPAPRSLAELIGFNIRNGRSVLGRFGQEIFLQAEATSGDPADPAAQACGPPWRPAGDAAIACAYGLLAWRKRS